MTNRKLAYIVKDQKPLTVAGNETVRRACQLMRDSRAGSALVVDTNGRLLGIFTGRDAVRLLANGRESDAPLASAMTPHPVTATPDGRAIDAMKAMVAGGFRHVPVVDGNEIVGVVSRGDFKGMEFEAFDWPGHCARTGMAADRNAGAIVARQKPLVLGEDEAIQRACQLMRESASGSVLAVDANGRLSGIFTGRDAVRLLAREHDAARARLAAAMTPGPVTIEPTRPAISALQVMSDGGFRHLPVVDDGVIRGVVSRSDFTAVEIDRLDEEEHLAECIW